MLPFAIAFVVLCFLAALSGGSRGVRFLAAVLALVPCGLVGLSASPALATDCFHCGVNVAAVHTQVFGLSAVPVAAYSGGVAVQTLGVPGAVADPHCAVGGAVDVNAAAGVSAYSGGVAVASVPLFLPTAVFTPAAAVFAFDAGHHCASGVRVSALGSRRVFVNRPARNRAFNFSISRSVSR